ncbi:unnamed protein product, partial [Anisakis simplex]|uniref:tRNA (adenine(58)-N(1))-methyltransferase non-catalytic subunit TRM6 n=1 Tax=Anisakis simplex TaxID=6269 RepID=A0A0M3J7X2_ANISI
MITSGCHAIVQKLGGEHIRVCELGRKRMILIEKLRFNADGALNQPFGLFEVSAGKLSRVYEDVSNVEQTSITDLEKDTDAVRTEPSSLETATIPAACSSSEENGQNAASNHDQDVRNSDELNADDPSPIDRVSDIQSQESEPLDGEPVDTRNPAQSRQKLTQEEISLMKNTGISTDEL